VEEDGRPYLPLLLQRAPERREEGREEERIEEMRAGGRAPDFLGRRL
jgi:hypothetical protein